MDDGAKRINRRIILRPDSDRIFWASHIYKVPVGAQHSITIYSIAPHNCMIIFFLGFDLCECVFVCMLVFAFRYARVLSHARVHKLIQNAIVATV